MSYILDVLEEYTKKDPEYVFLYDETNTKGLSYAKFDEMTGRVYAYLKENGIGKEDFVLINLARGIMPIVAMVGVWKAGAAWALVEDTYAPDRIEYIRNDCGCKTEINHDTWEKIMNTEPIKGHVTPDMHDASYAIYTSGTTGNPKGVLHEYGNLQRAIDSIKVNGEVPFSSKDRLALLAPLNFVASVIVILNALSVFMPKIYIVSYSTIKNPGALASLFITKRISVTFLTPSYVRKLGNKSSPFLRMLFVGSEPANNISSNSYDLINIYACSESGFAVGVFKIDQAYETCPIGKPEVDTKIVLLGEDGNEVSDGETGELCFENPYVRGYLHLEEETKKAFVDGMYHSGDLAKKDSKGNYVILGRSGDMIKINGNRIEPAEIEAAVKQVLGISWAAAKGIENGEKSFLCVYYTDDVAIDSDYLRQELLKRLPYYMIPAYYMKIDEVPLKASGKLDRKALPNPDADDFRSEYVAPEGEIEEKLCSAFEKVLKVSRFSATDDFYELGGDSLTSIEVISECDLPGLNASEIFRGRTPQKIAKIYAELHANDSGESNDEKNERSLKNEHKLTTEQLYMVDYQLYTPKSTMYNLFSVMKFDKEVFDVPRLAETLEKVIKNHPALLTTYNFNDDGEIVQKYTPEVFSKINVEKISEWEFDTLKDTLVQPFKIIGGCLYRCRVFETEKSGYIFFDVHHTLFDGTSLKVFLGNVGKAYMDMELDPDYYYLMLQKREDDESSEFYKESKEYFESRFEGVEWSSYPKIDHESRENKMGEIFDELGIEQLAMSEVEKSYMISRNEFFITVAGISIAIFNKENDIRLSWIYNGREDLSMMSSVGLIFRDLPVGFRFHDTDTVRNIFADVHNQVQKGIEHSCYPYVDITSQVGTNEAAYLLYQQDIRDMSGLEGVNIETVNVKQNQAASQTILDMEILDGADGLQIMIDYAASRYEEATIVEFKDLFKRVATSLIGANSQTDVTFAEIRKKVSGGKGIFDKIKGLFSK